MGSSFSQNLLPMQPYKNNHIIFGAITLASLLSVWWFNHWTISLFVTFIFLALMGLNMRFEKNQALLDEALHHCTKKEADMREFRNRISDLEKSSKP